MTRNQRLKVVKYKLKEWAKKIGRWSGTRKGRHSKKDKAKTKQERIWNY